GHGNGNGRGDGRGSRSPRGPLPRRGASGYPAASSRGDMGADENLRAGVIVAGRYRIERALGEGGMSTVYAVRHARTGERRALKLLRAGRASGDPRAAELFRREMQAPARIGSEHVVRVTDADVAPELGDAPFLVMELLRGRDLEREVAARGALPA